MPTTKQARLELYPSPELRAAIEEKAAAFGMPAAAFAKAVLGIVCDVDEPTSNALAVLVPASIRRRRKREKEQ
jgi:hypothetical protein